MKTIPQPLRWHGGKAYQAGHIIAQMPPHTRYCEPYFGGGAVLFAKSPEGVAEFVNDIHGDLVGFYRVLREKAKFEEFQRMVEATPFSPVEFNAAKTILQSTSCSDVERAHAFFVRYRQSRQGLAKCFATPTSRTRRGMNEQVSAWLTAVDGLAEAHARLRRVEVRQQDAVDFIQELDSEQTLFYLDPPYLHETRSTRNCYEFEMTPEQHQALLDVLQTIKGKFLLSGYPSTMYDTAAQRAGWNRSDLAIDNKASSAKKKEKKTECLWRNF